MSSTVIHFPKERVSLWQTIKEARKKQDVRLEKLEVYCRENGLSWVNLINGFDDSKAYVRDKLTNDYYFIHYNEQESKWGV